MTEIVKPTRAKSVSIAVDRVDKVGKRKNAKTRNHIVPLAGMATTKEAYKIGRDMAKELGVDESRIRVETYADGKAPMEANPRHRGSQVPRWERPSTQHEVAPRVFQRIRRVFSGGMPQTPEEWAQHVKDFEARKTAVE